jgi:alanine dehydrogenase
MKADPHLAAGLNVAGGYITYKAVADDLDLPYRAAA